MPDLEDPSLQADREPAPEPAPEAQPPPMQGPSPGEPEGGPPAPPPQVTAVVCAGYDACVAEQVIDDLARVLADCTADFELLVLGDAGTEETAVGVGEAKAQRPEARFIRREGLSGYGDALREAVAEARFPLVLVMDRPCSVDGAGLEALLAEAEHCHVALSLRGRRAGGLRPLLADWLLRAIARVIFGIPLTGDRPVRLYRREIFDRIRIQSHGRFADAEILAKAGFFGMLIGEAPIEPEAVVPGSRATVHPEPLRSTLRDAWQVFVHPLLLPPEEQDLPPSDAKCAEGIRAGDGIQGA